MLLTKKKLSGVLLLCLATAVPSFAQNWRQGGDRGGPPMSRTLHGEHGRWWDNPHVAQQIGLTDDQKKKMDDIFEQHRLQLVDLNATLEKDEIVLHPLLQADQLDEQKILAQIDAIAQARAELEKAHARMLFGIRKVLTPDQWKKLQAVVHEHRMGEGMDGRRDWQGRSSRDWNRHDGPQPPQGPGPGPDGPPPPQAPPQPQNP